MSARKADAEAAKIAEVFLAPVGTMIDMPDTRVVERPGWYQIVTPSTGSSIGNEVVLSQLGADAEAVVRATIREYAAHGVAFKWAVGPLTEPADLGALLERYDFTFTDVRGMAIDPSAWRARATPGVTVELSTDAAEYLDVFARGWGDGFTTDPALWIEPHARAIAAGTHCCFLARVDAVGVGTAGVAIKPRSGYLIGGNVIDGYRGRGVYRALIGARLELLAARGITLATTQARESSSAPMLEHMGFESVFRSRIYRLADPRDCALRHEL